MMGSFAARFVALFSGDCSAGELFESPRATDPAKVEVMKSRREKGMGNPYVSELSENIEGKFITLVCREVLKRVNHEGHEESRSKTNK
jgi:hypothetical protein